MILSTNDFVEDSYGVPNLCRCPYAIALKGKSEPVGSKFREVDVGVGI